MTVGFVGLGKMGSGMAASLQRAGHELVVHDARREAAEPLLAAGASWADTPAEVARGAEQVFTSLPGPPEVEAVALGPGGLIGALEPGATFVDVSTNSPELIRRIDRAFAARGIGVLDAPVSGGIAAARNGTLTLWVGGAEDVFVPVKPLLDALATEVIHVGPIGAGDVVKLIHNSIAIAINQVLTEGLTLGVKAGVEPASLWSALGQGALGSYRIVDRMAKILVRQLEPVGFQLALAEKDVRLARQLAIDVGVPVQMIDAAYCELLEGINAGMGAQDSVVVSVLQERRAGAEIIVSQDQLDAAATT